MAVPATQEQSTAGLQQGIMRAATIILLGNILSRVVGFVRDIAITTIFGINLVVNSIRAGIDIFPMIGPRISPRNRSMIVQAAPPAT